MSSDLSPKQRRLAREAEKIMADPQTEERIREAHRLLATDPRVVDGAQRFAQAVAPTLLSIGTALRSWVSQIDWEGVRTALRTLSDAIAGLLPPNARGLGTDYWPALQSLAKDEQLCLSWVPDTGLARSLLDAPDGVERERLLVEASSEIWRACEDAIATVTGGPPEELLNEEPPEDIAPSLGRIAEAGDLLVASLKAARAGHAQAAQALATCVTDTLLEQHVNRRRGRTHSFLKHRLSQAEEAQFIGLVIGPTLAAAESSFRQPGMWIESPEEKFGPTPYSRHATVHAVSAEVFTEATAIKAVLLATSVLLLSTNPLLFVFFDSLDTPIVPTSVDIQDVPEP